MVLTLWAGLMLIFTAESMAGAAPDVSYNNGLLSLRAEKTPLLNILKSISAATGIQVLVSKDFAPVDISIRFADQPLESALKRILASYNHAVFYQKKDGDFKVSEIRVYPKGTDSGQMRTLIDRAPAVEDRTLDATDKEREDFKPLPAEDIPAGPARPAVGRPGLLTPKPYSGPQKSERGVALGQQFEAEEQAAFAEIEALKKQMDLTENTAERDALQVVYMDKLAAFEDLQRRNQNRMEAMHRIELFENGKKNNEQTK